MGSFSLDKNSQYGSPLALDFGPVVVGQTSPQRVVTLSNQSFLTGLTGFAGGAVDAPFNDFQDCSNGVAPSGSCHWFFTFAPTSPGTFTAVSSSTDSAGPLNISLRGVGVGAELTATPLSLDFGPQVLGSTQEQTVTLRNTGMAPLMNVAGGGVPAPFEASQDCANAGGIPPGGICHFFYTFLPTSVGFFKATSAATTNGGSMSIALRGIGLQLGSSPPGTLFLPLLER